MVKNRYYAVIKKKIKAKFLNKAIKSKSDNLIEELLKERMKYSCEKVDKKVSKLPNR